MFWPHQKWRNYRSRDGRHVNSLYSLAQKKQGRATLQNKPRHTGCLERNDLVISSQETFLTLGIPTDVQGRNECSHCSRYFSELLFPNKRVTTKPLKWEKKDQVQQHPYFLTSRKYFTASYKMTNTWQSSLFTPVLFHIVTCCSK